MSYLKIAGLGELLVHSLVTVVPDIAYSVYTAQMVFTYCQPPVAWQVDCHYKGA